MTTVKEQISNLLFTHECIVVPDLGAFVTTTISARLDTDKNVLMPPSKEIGFNRSLSHNDGVLITSLAQANGISYGKAKIMVEEFVSEVMTDIQKGLLVTIEKVGTLKKDAIGLLQFVADNSESYLTDSYGLTSFHFTPVVKMQPKVAENRQVQRALRPVGLKQIAATVAMVVGLFAISQKLDSPVNGKHMATASTISFATPTQSNVVGPSIEVTAEEVSAAIEHEAVIEAPVVKNSYYLIAGSFKVESQAERFLSIIHEMGEEQAFVLASPNNRYRVAINGYADKGSAVEELNAYRQKEDFKTVWVLTQK